MCIFTIVHLYCTDVFTTSVLFTILLFALYFAPDTVYQTFIHVLEIRIGWSVKKKLEKNKQIILHM